jgi:Arc/MetJ family transcription regulator
MTLRAQKVLDGSSNLDRQAIEIDARVCAEVTEIIRRLLAEEFS